MKIKNKFFFQGTRRPEFEKLNNFDFNYDKYWLERGTKLRSKLLSREKIFFDWTPEGSSVLDLACGNSSLLFSLKTQKNCRVKGLDISRVAVAAQKEKSIEAEVCDITDSDFKITEKYDYIILSEILEHLVFPEEVIKKAKEKSDYIIASIPNSAFYRYRLGLLLKGRFFTQWSRHPAEHLRFWSHKDFCDWLKAFDLKTIECKSSNGLKFGFIDFSNYQKNLFGHQICYFVKTVK